MPLTITIVSKGYVTDNSRKEKKIDISDSIKTFWSTLTHIFCKLYHFWAIEKNITITFLIGNVTQLKGNKLAAVIMNIFKS